MADTIIIKVEIGEFNEKTINDNLTEESSQKFQSERSETKLIIKEERIENRDMDTSPIDYSLPSRRSADNLSPSQDVYSHSIAAVIRCSPELSSAKRNHSHTELDDSELQSEIDNMEDFSKSSPKPTKCGTVWVNGANLEECVQQPAKQLNENSSSTDEYSSDMSDVDVEDDKTRTETSTGALDGTENQNGSTTERLNPEEARKILESISKQIRRGRRPKGARERIKFSDCPQCKKTFSSIKSLRRHIQDIHMNDPQLHRCTQCDKSFKAKSYLYGHIQRVHAKNSPGESGLVEKIEVKPRAVNPNKEPYNCSMCEAVFVNKHGLVDHIKIVHEEKPYECNFCDKRFTQSGSLSSHMRSVHCGEKRYSCDQCGFKFSQKSNLATHKRNIHEGLKSFHCSECDYKASTKGHLDRHWKAVHIKERRFPCFECGKAFSCKEGLRIHIDSVHRKYRPFTCEECFKSFPRSIDLKQHVDAVHNGIKPYPCVICGMCFSQNCNLTRHMNAMHGGAISGLLEDPTDSLNASYTSFNETVSEYLGQINQSIDDYLASDSSMRGGESDDQTDESTSDRLKMEISSEEKLDSDGNSVDKNSQMSASVDEESGDQMNSFNGKSVLRIDRSLPGSEGAIDTSVNLGSVLYVKEDEL